MSRGCGLGPSPSPSSGATPLGHADREARTRGGDEEAGEEDQALLFAPISAVPLAAGHEPDWVLDGGAADAPPDGGALTITLPPARRAQRPRAGVPDGTTRREHEDHLREANADASRLIARQTGLSHAAVNAGLNRSSGVNKVSEAIIEQLERRLRKAEQWVGQTPARRGVG